MSSFSLTSEYKYKKEHYIGPLNTIINNSIHYRESIKKKKCSYESATDSNSNIKDFQISNSSFTIKKNKSLLLPIKSLSREKLLKQYNCYPNKYYFYIINNLLRNDNCHIVSLFKDILINDSNVEFFYKYYNFNEIKKSLKKSYIFYKNYFNFYCKPTFRCIPISLLMKNYFDLKAKYFLNLNNHDNDNLENNLSNNNIDDKTIESLTSDIIFNYNVKEFLDNITNNTNRLDNSITNTINLNMDNDKLEIYPENKKDYSNNLTFEELINYIENKNKNNTNIKCNKKVNIIKKQLLKNKNNAMNNDIKKNKNNNELNGVSLNLNSFTIKNKIPIYPIKIILKKMQIKKGNKKNAINNKINYLLDNKKSENHNKNNNSLKSENGNIKNVLFKSFNLKNYQKEQLKINKKKSNFNKFVCKSEIFNDEQNKEIINNNYQILLQKKNIKQKIIKNINNILHNNKVNNQKILFNKKKISRNNILFYQTVHNVSSKIHNNQFNHNIKNKSLEFKYLSKNKVNINKKKSTDNSSKTINSLTKYNHLRYKTKFIGNNHNKIFKNLNSRYKKVIPTNYHLNTAHINKTHNYNKSILFHSFKKENINTISIINNSNTIFSKTNINIPINNINTPLNCYCQKSINNSIYNDKNYTSFKTKLISKIKNKIKDIKDNIRQDYLKSNQNSINTTHQKKSIPLLNKTFENINFISNINNSNNYKNNSTNIKHNKKFTYVGNLNFVYKKICNNITANKNDSNKYIRKLKIDINEKKKKN